MKIPKGRQKLLPYDWPFYLDFVTRHKDSHHPFHDAVMSSPKIKRLCYEYPPNTPVQVDGVTRWIGGYLAGNGGKVILAWAPLGIKRDYWQPVTTTEPLSCLPTKSQEKLLPPVKRTMWSRP